MRKGVIPVAAGDGQDSSLEGDVNTVVEVYLTLWNEVDDPRLCL